MSTLLASIPIRTFLYPGLGLVGIGVVLLVLGKRRRWPLIVDAVAGLSFTVGASSAWVSMATIIDGPQTYLDLRDAFSSFYDSWPYVGAYGGGATAVVLIVAAAVRRSLPSLREVLAIAIGCMTAAVVVGLLDESISPW